MDLKKIKQTAKTKIEDVKAFYKLHRNTVNASIAAFAGALVSAVVITKKCGDTSADEEDGDSYDWRNDPQFEKAEVDYNGEKVKGAWFRTETDGRIFFAENEDGSLP